MGIDGINGGYIPNLGVPAGAGEAGKAAATGAGREIDGAKLALLAEQLKAGVAVGNRAATLAPPAEVGPQAAAGAAKGLAMLQGDQVNADMFAFLALFQKLAQTMRDSARTERAANLQQQVASLQSAADEMRSAAADRLTAGILQGVGSMAAGASQMAGGIKGTQASIATGTGTGQMIQGGFGIAASGFTYAADMHDAKKTDYETAAKVAESGAQQANDMMQQMMDIIRDVRDKLQSIQQASLETNRGIARNI
ncbi:MAG TPA: hypothetical protein VFE82_18705 [Ramlibacter sp.]|jgi:hypothetical protein|uniref:hypothetical protein n=1 Tax=Ramlibacter sp. TaxID=1917967 RepID=UPI002D67354E|nr:hypothetical protein [Ramlibacter sp.]HZY20507.1 hypothetical protein [Ramlibacter sp.]